MTVKTTNKEIGGDNKRFTGDPYDNLYMGQQFFGISTEDVEDMKKWAEDNFNPNSFDPQFIRDAEYELNKRAGIKQKPKGKKSYNKGDRKGKSNFSKDTKKKFASGKRKTDEASDSTKKFGKTTHKAKKGFVKLSEHMPKLTENKK